MDGERKYFGMTMMQIGIIVGMVGLLCLILGVGGWFVLKNFRGGGVSPIAQVPPTIQPTVTPLIVMSPTAVITPTLTPIPYEQLIPADWKQFKTPLVEIWLPKNFKLADKKTVNNTAAFSGSELLITEIPSKSSAYNMLVNISYELMTGDSLDTFVRDQFPTLPYQAHVSDYQTVSINSVEGRKIMIELRVNNIDINDMVYVFQDGNTVWYVQYMAQIAEFYDNLPVFEQSVKTFRPTKY
jgi:hypothetical protein